MLLAKSPSKGLQPTESQRLPGHLCDVTNVADHLMTRSDMVTVAAGLPPSAAGRLRTIVPRAAWLHDLGKANDHFQRMVRGDLRPQGLRHEVVSVLMLLERPELAEWILGDLAPTDRDVVLLAVVGHHLKFDRDRAQPDPFGTRMAILADDPDFARSLRAASHRFERPEIPAIAAWTINPESPSSGAVLEWALELHPRWQHATADDRKLVSLVRALVIAADSAGSALPVLGQDPGRWAAAALGVALDPGWAKTTALARLDGRPLRDFQAEVAASTHPVTIVQAGCGTGKTAAAWLWAAQSGRRRLVFCYPTTGTATQGWSDYPGEEATLQHSRALADLDVDGLMANGEDDQIEQAAVLRSLRSWATAVTVCTAHSVLGSIQNHRSSHSMLPVVLDAALVFDEIHQYDGRLFGALLRWLEAFPGIPTLLMTASLQPDRLTALRQCLGHRMGLVEGPVELETMARYQLDAATQEDAWGMAIEAAAAGQRVLWVSNTVRRAIEGYLRAAGTGVERHLYHSRYRYGDRVKQHQAVVASFRRGARAGGAIAFTTQVCEVSLDISADLLVTDLAPAPAMVQRLGRLNRWAEPGASPQRAVWIEPDSAPPYPANDLDVARRWIDGLGRQPLSQHDLAQGIAALPSEPVGRTTSQWLDEPVWALRDPLTEGEQSVPIIAMEDLARLPAAASRGHRLRALIEATVPLPLGNHRVGSWRREGGALVAPAGAVRFDETGGHWV